MKLSKRKLRMMINESISRNLNEAQFTTKGLGSVLRYGGMGIGGFLGSFVFFMCIVFPQTKTAVKVGVLTFLL